MSAPEARAVLRADYTPYPWQIESTHLHFELTEEDTLVHARLVVRRLADTPAGASLVLQGRALETLSLSIDGVPLTPEAWSQQGEELHVQVPDGACFEFFSVVRIHPASNTSLMGLYRSSGLLCTQCEPEGFRRITWYPDRPDVLSRFRVTLDALRTRYPVLLANGNPVERTDLGDSRHRVVWEDPFPKPAYLFALVAGELACLEDSFTTCSGREVALQIYSAPADADRLGHAMVSLKHAMRWDEENYGREYDLDIFMIVAVADFNMGAMENKGLNIFNAAALLASPETATDVAWQRIEAIVAHEYFHNWSGNRVTCRDWFQLSLKEGFTVFRDAQFSADMNSPTLKRIQDVNRLRTAQFAEDAGPMAHPIRPDSYLEIANFYTMTIYEKGAEVIRMLRTLLRAEGFRQGSDLYFARHDGQAATCDDFLQAMADATGTDLTGFARWYAQAGTPRLTVRGEWLAAEHCYRVHLAQRCLPTPGQVEKQPFVIPVALALFGADGKAIETTDGQGASVAERVVVLEQAEQSFEFHGVQEVPVLSVLRGFSAPVMVAQDCTRDELAFLIRHETDGFNRWDAAQRLGVQVLQEMIAALAAGKRAEADPILLQSLGAVLADETLDLALCAELLVLPGEHYLAGLGEAVDVDLIRRARDALRRAIQAAHSETMRQRYLTLHAASCAEPYLANGGQIARRALQGVLLGYLVLAADDDALALCVAQYQTAHNLTLRLGALGALLNAPTDASGYETARVQLRADFAERHASVAQVMDSWFAVQAGCVAGDAVARVRRLILDPRFSLRNPNRARAVIGSFCANLPAFHRRDGEGYRFLCEQVLAADALNPQLSGRMVSPLTQWRRHDAPRQQAMLASLESLKTQGGLSRDLYEIVSKSLSIQ
ncbi:MAG: aminopeptidase N [Candidatus Dactylopiibacterium carminicum]|nr:MAG: aminopeptidase N [Candidatus Dactylopiibacterium carminicum]